MWGTVGFAYNVDMIKQRMPDAPVTSLDMLFKPELAAKWADCGISILESPTDMIPLALSYLHRDPNSQKAEDYAAAAALFRPIRQYVKAVDSANYLNQLPNQELCLAFSWSGDYATAASRAEEAGVKIDLAYSVPDTGGPAWFDGWLIPSDAPHPENALIFINYMLRPKVIAAATNFTNYANANKASAAVRQQGDPGEPGDLPGRGDAGEALRAGRPAAGGAAPAHPGLEPDQGRAVGAA